MALKFGTWSSARLTYRGIEESDDGFFTHIFSDVDATVAASPKIPTPPDSRGTKARLEHFQSELLAVVICLSSSNDSSILEADQGDDQVKPVHGEPIGFLTLGALHPRMEHHGKTSLAIGILQPYRSQGYGTEALQWSLYWGFTFARLHRIELATIQFNEGAKRLYERVGFREEGVKREAEWKYGRWWDNWEGAILEHEWREKYGAIIVGDEFSKGS